MLAQSAALPALGRPDVVVSVSPNFPSFAPGILNAREAHAVDDLAAGHTPRLAQELGSADIALVSQRYDGAEFNVPSKIMNFMAHGLSILAVVNP